MLDVTRRRPRHARMILKYSCIYLFADCLSWFNCQLHCDCHQSKMPRNCEYTLLYIATFFCQYPTPPPLFLSPSHPQTTLTVDVTLRDINDNPPVPVDLLPSQITHVTSVSTSFRCSHNTIILCRPHPLELKYVLSVPLIWTRALMHSIPTAWCKG